MPNGGQGCPSIPAASVGLRLPAPGSLPAALGAALAGLFRSPCDTGIIARQRIDDAARPAPTDRAAVSGLFIRLRRS